MGESVRGNLVALSPPPFVQVVNATIHPRVIPLPLAGMAAMGCPWGAQADGACRPASPVGSANRAGRPCRPTSTLRSQ